MENLVDLDVNSVLNWIKLDKPDDSNWTKYVNKVENVLLKWNNLKITVVTKRSFWDYILWFIFFMMRYTAIILIPICLLLMFWFNFTNSFGDIKDKIDGAKSNISNSLNLSLESVPMFEQTSAVNDYIWLMDELLNW